MCVNVRTNFQVSSIILTSINQCATSVPGTADTFKITETKLYVTVATLSTKNNVKLAKQLSDEFNRSVY